MSGAYYNEHDKFAAAWLRNLIRAGLIMDGEVDERSIIDVRGSDLAGFERCHFFAGIAGWELALQYAGWRANPVWSGSCPCQPFSGAGQRKGHADERHLWPAFHRLIAECRPATVFGEQVASADGREWFAAVRSDLEALGYAIGGADLCAAGVGAPHIRQRLYWVADAKGNGRRTNAGAVPRGEATRICEAARSHVRRSLEPARDARDSSAISVVADSNGDGRRRFGVSQARDDGPFGDGAVGFVGNADSERLSFRNWLARDDEATAGPHRGQAAQQTSPWCDLEWLACTDGKARPTEPGLFPLAHGIPGRVGRLRAYGNAIVPQVGAEFIAAFMEGAA